MVQFQPPDPYRSPPPAAPIDPDDDLAGPPNAGGPVSCEAHLIAQCLVTLAREVRHLRRAVEGLEIPKIPLTNGDNGLQRPAVAVRGI